LRAADGRTRNLAYILSEYVRGAFTAGDAALRQLAVRSIRLGGPGGDSEDWTPILSSTLAALNGVGSISIVDASGVIRHSTVSVIVGQSRRDEYIFRQLSTVPADELVVGTPYLTVTTPRVYIIPIGRRLMTADGRFAGCVVATFVPAQLREFFRTVDIGQRGLVTVFHPQGVVLFREPSDTSATGEAATGTPLFEAARASAIGTLLGPIAAGGDVYLSAFRQTPSPPLITVVSRDPNELLADWWQDVRTSIAFFAVFAVMTAIGVVVLLNQTTARARAEDALMQTERDKTMKLQEARDQLEAALAAEQRARHDAEAASYLKDQFLMTLSHELRTPMTAIYGWSRLLADGKVDARQQARALDAIARNSQTQMHLIDDLLDVSRGMSGKLRLDIRPVRPREVLDAAIDALKTAADAKQLDLIVTVDPDADMVMADPHRLQQILWNLLSNAIKFTPPGGRIAAKVARSNAHVELAVTDSGSGISPEFLPYVFDRFRQQDSSSRRRHGGLGLGLAIVRQLVELHGGSVTAESDGEGRGATFRVRLPVVSPSPELVAADRRDPIL
jgi:signal transduction histidine kinase